MFRVTTKEGLTLAAIAAAAVIYNPTIASAMPFMAPIPVPPVSSIVKPQVMLHRIAPKPTDTLPLPPVMPKTKQVDRSMEAHVSLELGVAAQDGDKLSEATTYFKRVIALSNWSELPSYDAAVANGRLGTLYAETGDYKQAIVYSSKALSLFERLEGPINNDVGTELNNLAWLNWKVNDYRHGKQLFEQAVSVFRGSADQNDQMIGKTENNFGDLLSAQNNWHQAYAHYKKAYKALKSYYGSNYPETKAVLHKLIRERNLIQLETAMAV